MASCVAVVSGSELRISWQSILLSCGQRSMASNGSLASLATAPLKWFRADAMKDFFCSPLNFLNSHAATEYCISTTSAIMSGSSSLPPVTGLIAVGSASVAAMAASTSLMNFVATSMASSYFRRTASDLAMVICRKQAKPWSPFSSASRWASIRSGKHHHIYHNISYTSLCSDS